MKCSGFSFKFSVGFLLVGAVVLTVGFTGWKGVSVLSRSIEDIARVRLPGVQSLMSLQYRIAEIKAAHRYLLNPGLSTGEMAKQQGEIAGLLQQCQERIEAYRAGTGGGTEDLPWKRFMAAWSAWRKDSDAFLRMSETLMAYRISNPVQLRRKLEMFKGEHFFLQGQVGNMIQTEMEIEGGEDPDHAEFGHWLRSYRPENPEVREIMAAAREPHEALHRAVGAIKEHIRRGDVDLASLVYEEEMRRASQDLADQLERLRAITVEVEALYEKMNAHEMNNSLKTEAVVVAALDQMIQRDAQSAAGKADRAMTSAQTAGLGSLAALALGVFFAAGLGVVLARSVTRPVERVKGGLSRSSQILASVSTEVSHAGMSISKGSTLQFSFVDEAAERLRQVTGLARQNAEKADEVRLLMNDSGRGVRDTNSLMNQVAGSMEEINAAGGKIRTIVRTIEDIAFQIHLLSLNASVEAARAGDSGRGFAVVAGEVKKLAKRSSDAARETAALIEEAVAAVDEGGRNLARTRSVYDELVESVLRAGEMVETVNEITNEQTLHIETVNRTMEQMVEVAHKNLADTKTFTVAFSELRGQIDTIHQFNRLLAG